MCFLEFANVVSNPQKNSWEIIKNARTILNKGQFLVELAAYKNPAVIISTYKRETLSTSYNRKKSCFTVNKKLLHSDSWNRPCVYTDLDGSGEAKFY